MNHPTRAPLNETGLPFEAKLVAGLFALAVAALAFITFGGALGR